ncbi:MAG: ABC transporter permease [Actinomycetota bacterium]|nr:ABC transporter permease [Actinomycetota bacterium]
MTTTTLNRSTVIPTAHSKAEKVTAGRVLNAEWIKFRSLRSSWYTLAAAIASMVGIGAVIGYTSSTATWSELEPGTAAASGPLQGFFLAQLFIGMLGVLFVTGEYGTGMIRSTFAAVPRRWPVLGAKGGVFGAVALVAMTLASFAAFFAAQLFLGPDGHGSSLADPGALRAVAGTGVYLTLIGMLGGALGWILRSTASAIAALLGMLMILPLLVGFLPGSAGETVGKYLPSEAGEALASSLEQPDLLAPGASLAVLALWVAGALAVGFATVRRRDA